ncbi:MAG: conjugal transfer protein TrbL family protein, partial [bacterium]
VMMVLWINPNWGGYLSEWIRRSSSLIFTQFIQVLILALYSKLVHRFFISGSISSLCLAAAFLILMTNVPSLLQRFIAPDSSGAIMAKTYRSITNKPKQYNSIKSNIKSKFNKIIKKK